MVMTTQVDDLSVECLAGTEFKLREERGELFVDWDPELLAGLALDDGDEALVDLAPLHDEHIRHALPSVKREGCGFPEIGARMLPKVLDGIPGPGRPAF